MKKIVELLSSRNCDIFGSRPVTIAFFGDSVTQGCFECYKDKNGNVETVYEPSSSYVAKFGSILNKLYPRAHINIINAGVGGDTASNAVNRLERDVLQFHPDLVVVNFALNDSGAGVVGIDGYRSSMETILQKILDTGAEAVLLTPALMCNYVSAHIIEPVIQRVAQDFVNRMHGGVLEQYVNVAVKVAKKMSIPVCDCYTIWKNMQKSGVDTTMLLANYLNHPVREMHWLFAFNLAETLFGI